MGIGYQPGIEATLYENWPAALKQHSIPTRLHPLSYQDMIAFGSVDPSFRTDCGIGYVQDFSSEFTAWLTTALRAMSTGLFLRTSYGSFRECPLSRIPAKRMEEAFAVLRWVDSRLLRHLRFRLDNGGTVYLLAREWREIPVADEYRIFVRGGSVIGISPYHSHMYFPQVQRNAPRLHKMLRHFADTLIRCLHYDPIILDVRADANEYRPVVELIELTPFIEAADACLFDWRDPSSFHGGFRFRTPDGYAELRES